MVQRRIRLIPHPRTLAVVLALGEVVAWSCPAKTAIPSTKTHPADVTVNSRERSEDKIRYTGAIKFDYGWRSECAGNY